MGFPPVFLDWFGIVTERPPQDTLRRQGDCGLAFSTQKTQKGRRIDPLHPVSQWSRLCSGAVKSCALPDQVRMRPNVGPKKPWSRSPPAMQLRRGAVLQAKSWWLSRGQDGVRAGGKTGPWEVPIQGLTWSQLTSSLGFYRRIHELSPGKAFSIRSFCINRDQKQANGAEH